MTHPLRENNSPSGMLPPFDLLPIEGGRIKVRIRLQEAQDVIDAALIDDV